MVRYHHGPLIVTVLEAGRDLLNGVSDYLKLFRYVGRELIARVITLVVSMVLEFIERLYSILSVQKSSAAGLEYLDKLLVQISQGRKLAVAYLHISP